MMIDIFFNIKNFKKIILSAFIISFSISLNIYSEICFAKENNDVNLGRKLFHQIWRPVDLELNIKGGLGPLYTRRSCSGCHIQNGRSRKPVIKNNLKEMIVKVGVFDKNKKKYIGHPILGMQLQDKGIFGIKSEGKIELVENKILKILPNGKIITLYIPNYYIKGLEGQVIQNNLLLSPRIPPPLFGLGLLEAIDIESIKSYADPYDQNNDGISGKYKKVYDIKNKKLNIGKFGWKSDQPSIFQQVAFAFNKDLGLTNPVYPETNCPMKQLNCKLFLAAPTIELTNLDIEKVVSYIKNIDVPIKKNLDKNLVKNGENIFFSLKCNLCHKPSWVTGSSNSIEKLNNKTIFPYTDLLLHDMGDELADRSTFPTKDNREWRTPALWGLVSVSGVLEKTKYLHDGRAKSIIEAILWHGGEALQSRKKFEKLNQSDQNDLIYFLKSL